MNENNTNLPEQENLEKKTQDKQNTSSEKQEERKKKVKKAIREIIDIALVIIIILLLLRSCNGNPQSSPIKDTIIDSPIGNFIVSGEQQVIEKEPEQEKTEKATITFAGYGRYEVSKDRPNVELQNPEENFVAMVFTLSDKATGEVFARTQPVEPGKFVYVNVMDFYTEPGNYDVGILVSTYDMEANKEMNGINQSMEIIVK